MSPPGSGGFSAALRTRIWGVFRRSAHRDKNIDPYGASAGTPPRNEKNMYGMYKKHLSVAKILFRRAREIFGCPWGSASGPCPGAPYGSIFLSRCAGGGKRRKTPRIWGGFVPLWGRGLKNLPIWGFSWYPPEKRKKMYGMDAQKNIHTLRRIFHRTNENFACPWGSASRPSPGPPYGSIF
jgi:hypothetical protein